MFNMQRLLAAQILFQHNIKILHWNVTGIGFDMVHNLLGDYYKEMDTFIDDTAEICKSLNVNVLNLHDVMQILENDQIAFMSLNGDDIFTFKECFEKLDNMFNTIIALYDEAFSSNGIPASIVGEMQQVQQWYRKECHFKNRQRLL